MTYKHEKVFDKEAIQCIDTHFAKCILVTELLRIPEFVYLWQRARADVSSLMEAIRLHCEAIGPSLSPMARDAIVMGEKGYGLYDEDTIREVKWASVMMQAICQAGEQAAEIIGIVSEYQCRMHHLFEPLGVPELTDYAVILDMRIWGLHQIFAGPVSGHAYNSMEVTVFEIFTDLRPNELAWESPANIRKKLDRKTAPLRSHMAKYDLNKRIQLWIRNVVLGEQISRIASEIHESDRWVQEQIIDATKTLEARRAIGRPPKDGVLRQWKLMSK